MTRLAALAAVLGLSACLGPVEFHGWDPKQFQQAQCDAPEEEPAACHEKAKAACPAGYEIGERRDDETRADRFIIFRCKA
jgi:hypothetical protein